MNEPVKLTPERWCQIFGLQILDPDGWRSPGDPAWTDRITAEDFRDRFSMSTGRIVDPFLAADLWPS